MAYGSDVIDEGFFRRYRELLDAEDAAFDELEHAYEDGDRAHWDADLAAWRKIVEKRCAFLERAGVTTPVRQRGKLAGRQRAVDERPCRVDDDRSVRPTKKWLAPAITSISVAAQSSVASTTDAGSRNSSCCPSTSCFGRRVAGDRSEVGRRKRKGGDRQPSGQPVVVGRQRHVGAERPAREHEREASGISSAIAATPACTSSRSPRPSSSRPGALLDAPEVEPQARDPRRRQAPRTAR